MYQVVTNGTPVMRDASQALHAGARPCAWMMLQRRSRTMRSSANALRSIVTGLWLAMSSSMQAAPVALISWVRRPPRETTTGS